MYDQDKQRLGGALLKLSNLPKKNELISWDDKVWTIVDISEGIWHIARGSLTLQLYVGGP